MWFIHKKEDYKCIKLANSNWLLSSITEESIMNGFRYVDYNRMFLTVHAELFNTIFCI